MDASVTFGEIFLIRIRNGEGSFELPVFIILLEEKNPFAYTFGDVSFN